MAKQKIHAVDIEVNTGASTKVVFVTVYRGGFVSGEYRDLRRGQQLQRMLADRADWARFVAMMEGRGWRWHMGCYDHDETGLTYFVDTGEIGHVGGSIDEAPWRQLLAAGKTPDEVVQYD